MPQSPLKLFQLANRKPGSPTAPKWILIQLSTGIFYHCPNLSIYKIEKSPPVGDGVRFKMDITCSALRLAHGGVGVDDPPQIPTKERGE